MSESMLSVTIKPDPTKLAQAFMNQNISSFLKMEVHRLAASVQRYSRQLTPVKTGLLRASITYTPVSAMLQSIVSTHRDYAIFVHEGTKYMRGRPFMKYGAAFAQIGVEKGIAQRLDEEFTKGFKNRGFNK